ncbi:MAG: NAD-dependent epimerase/dehydratase family protein [Clostridiales bacterium]|nr:NAD-dependent epimerase/dehydratase family protein [Clostridiales bacterium]
MYTENYISDLTNAQKNVKNINVLNNSKILITGAGGLICSAIVDFLLQINKTNNSNISVYCAARNYEKIEKRFLDKVSDSGFNFIKYDALEPINSEIDFDYIIHGASNANPSLYVEQPVETIMANFLGLKNILDYSKKHNTKKVLYISSSEVYGKKTSEQPYNENEYGFLDILNPRACYPSSKRASETLCVAYLKQYEVESVIVRPGHIYGPTMTDSDTRASSQFPKDVLNGKDIVMKSLGTQLRSYCYVIDCVSAIMTVLLNGKSGEAYNISNKHSVVTIRELAECFALVGGKKVIFDIPTDAEKAGYNLMDNSSLTSDKLESIGWQGEFDLRRGVEATLDAARE